MPIARRHTLDMRYAHKLRVGFGIWIYTDSPLARILRQKDASAIKITSTSIEHRERRKLGMPSRVTTNISPRLRVVGVISLSWVKMGDTRCHIWDMSVHLETEHP